jgi:multidrug transporter EmrE-like cation transporter
VTVFLLALAGAIALGVTGQFLLKLGASAEGFVQQLLHPMSVVGLGAYFLSALLYMVALRKIPLSVAYPSVSASYVLVVLVSVLVLGEHVTWVQAGGLALICLGVVLLYA